MMLLLVFSLLLVVIAAMFAMGNSAPVTVAFLSYRFEGSLAIILLTAFAAGAAAGALALLPGFLTAKWRLAALRRQLRKQEESFAAPAAEAPRPPSPPL